MNQIKRFMKQPRGRVLNQTHSVSESFRTEFTNESLAEPQVNFGYVGFEMNYGVYTRLFRLFSFIYQTIL